ncbi:23S rRNA pseudouridine(1911/1915/1917) synthase RluD [Marinimicrobium sp. ABcell2]|uniref:23S rRNA pseudouridine(1911/1915/1917) synthase RluD n=1 Tax=Marinimicrobium sp. ABcell2 TaxID=3069751 RepID=UPI0027ADF9A6|nr:23S rRNA pseudouridine(1911/1915/1917) synthase RluD [Marinimicrobium sp. ABcell2]MDQ2078115.1 23S rRNA pseudouridine(1911/1915/1917) synthase RluD [Marinimicrobium sp. ABcell2]
MTDLLEKSVLVPAEMNGMRFDQAASALFPEFSRMRLQSWIKDGQLTLAGRTAKPKERLLGGENLWLRAQLEPQGEWEPESIDLDIVYEDEHLLVINKPAGLVVHPAAGNQTGTLLNALLHHCPELVNVPRAGIVHRLDKDTTGLMVVAKTLTAHSDLVAQLQARDVKREYEAVVIGTMTGGGRVDAPIGRHPKQRKQMAVVATGKPAVTHYRILTRFTRHTHIRVKLETGRTHQIRVHMAHINLPLVGDPTYAGRFKIPKGASPELVLALKSFPRQALHAASLGLEHPVTGEPCEWQVPLPEDMVALLAQLKAETQ